MYGRPPKTEGLKAIGLNIGHRRIARLMQQNGMSVVRTRKHKNPRATRVLVMQDPAGNESPLSIGLEKPCRLRTKGR
jgi:transposase InsO family protein